MQNREVPLGSLPIFFSSLRLAEAGRTCPEVRGGETGRGTRATVRGTQKTEPRARARGAGRGRRGHGHGRRVRGSGCGVRGAGAGRGCGCGTRKTRAWGAGRKTRNTWTRTRTRTRARARGAGDGRRGTGDGAQAPVHGTQRDRIRPARPRNNRPGPFTAGRHPPGPFTAGRPPPGPATTRRGHSQPGAIRHRDLQQPAGAVHSRAPSAAGRRYLSRVRIRITPLPPRTPYMLLPRCTSTDLTS